MAASCICRNQVIDYEGNAYRLVELLANRNWMMESMSDRARCFIPHDELINRYARGEIKLRVADLQVEAIEDKLRLATDPPLRLSRKNRKVIKKNIMLPNGDERSPEQQRRLRLSEALKKARLAEFASQYPLGSAIQEEAIRQEWPAIFGESAPNKLPSTSTLWRHLKKLSESGGDRRALIPMHHLKGRRKSSVPERIAYLISDVVEELYLKPLKRTVRETYDEVRRRVAAVNATPGGEQFKQPSMQKVRDYIEEIPAFDKHASRYGLPAAIKKFRARLSEVFASRPLERVELDATRLDLIAIDENGVTLGRPWLTVCIDVRTKCILGYCLTYEPPSLASLFECLKNALLPKDPELLKALGVVNPWPCYGAWQRLVMDNAFENHSTALNVLGSLWGLEISFCPRRKPWYKPSVERFMRTFNGQACHTVPGTTFSNIAERGDYNSKEEAVLNWQLIEQLVAQWINDVYHQRPHRTLGVSPMAAWKSLVRIDELLLPCDARSVVQVCRVPEIRRLTHKGIESDGLAWNSEDLREMRKEIAADLEVRVFFNRMNLGYVGVEHPVRRHIAEVRAINFDYANNLTLYQHETMRQFAKTNGIEDDVPGYLLAQARIRDMVSEAMRIKGYSLPPPAARFLVGNGARETPVSDQTSQAPPLSSHGEGQGAPSTEEFELEGADDDGVSSEWVS